MTEMFVHSIYGGCIRFLKNTEFLFPKREFKKKKLSSYLIPLSMVFLSLVKLLLLLK